MLFQLGYLFFFHLHLFYEAIQLLFQIFTSLGVLSLLYLLQKFLMLTIKDKKGNLMIQSLGFLPAGVPSHFVQSTEILHYFHSHTIHINLEYINMRKGKGFL